MDRREREQWYSSFDAKRMIITLEGAGPDGDDLELPARYVVCDVCDGKGTHVNPSIDSHGLSAEDFAEDPDFAEDYFAGRYDVPCHECSGQRVMPVMDEARTDAATQQRVNEWLDDIYAYAAECAAERRMGA